MTIKAIEDATREAVADMFTMDGPQQDVEDAIANGLLGRGFKPLVVHHIVQDARKRAGLDEE